MDIETYRNPFTLRASEKIADEDIFIRLFCTKHLDELQKKYESGNLWGNVLFLRIPPGGGKTTLLRAFSVKVLKSIIAFDDQSRRTILKFMQSLNVIENKCIKKCAVYLLMNRDYSYIRDEDNPNIEKRIFFALLNARIALAVVRTIIEIKELKINSLNSVLFCPPEEEKLFFRSSDNIPTNAYELYKWAENIESRILNYVNGYEKQPIIPNLYDDLFVFKVLKSKYFIYDGNPICEDFIFQLDDIHKLSNIQHEFLIDEVVEKRVDSTLWLSERLDLVPLEYILGNNNKVNRDYCIFEGKDSKDERDRNNSRNDKIYSEIADKRCQISLYSIMLKDSLEDNLKLSYEKKYKEVIKSCLSNLEENGAGLFVNWIKKIEAFDSMKDKAIAYKAIVLFLERMKKKTSLPFFPYDSLEYATKIDDDLKKLSWNLICSKNNIPMYFGFKILETLATNNVEQFIDFSGRLYDIIIGNYLIGNGNVRLNAESQDYIIKKHSAELFEKIDYLPYGKSVKRFLERLLIYCKNQTFESGSSYSIVTGFTIKCAGDNYFDKWYEDTNVSTELKATIKVCLANNLLIRKRVSQGGRGEDWIVFYMNRWLCVHGSLPLSYGGWRKLTINELNKWL